MFDAPSGVRIVLAPQTDKLVQMVRTQDGPIARQIIKVIHNDGHEQVDNLRPTESIIYFRSKLREIRLFNKKEQRT